MICCNHPDVAEGVRGCARCGTTFCPDCLVTIQGQSFCASCKTERLLDVRSGVDPTRLVYAGFWARFGAQVIDGLICGVPAYAIFVSAAMYAAAEMQRTNVVSPFILLGYVPLFVFPVVYEGLMLMLKNGQTVGKIALRLRVVRPGGAPITAGQAWGRAILRLALGCLFLVDYIPFFFTDEKTTLHDMVAGTRVVETASVR